METKPIMNINESNDSLINDSESSQIMVAKENKENNQRKSNCCSDQCKNFYGVLILSIFDKLFFSILILPL
jgi:hypothetical protein